MRREKGVLYNRFYSATIRLLYENVPNFWLKCSPDTANDDSLHIPTGETVEKNEITVGYTGCTKKETRRMFQHPALLHKNTRDSHTYTTPIVFRKQHSLQCGEHRTDTARCQGSEPRTASERSSPTLSESC